MTTTKSTLNNYILGIHAFVCVILLFVPILLDYNLILYNSKELTSHPIYNSIGSTEFKISICGSIAVLCPLILQILFRLSFEPLLAFSFKKSISIIWLIIWLLTTDATILFYVIPNHDLKMFNVIHQSSYIILTNFVTVFLNLYSECKIWRNNITIYTILILSSLRVVHNFSLYFHMDNELRMALTAFSIILLSVILIQCLRCFALANADSNGKSFSSNQILIGIYITSYFFVAAIFFIETSAENFGFYYNLTPNILVSQTCIYSLFYVILVVSQGNLLEREASLNALETKRMFIRYMSHEIRTPLNTVMMGLQHLQEEIMKRGECRSHLEIIRDIQESCDIAIKTLNDMLLYDKIENNTLEIEKESVQVVPLVMKIIQLFQAQAAHLGVKLSVSFLNTTTTTTTTNNNNNNNNNNTNNIICPWDNMVVTADPHKLSQIFRNVISNSLKFTPRNGSIDIHISAIPSPHTTHSTSSTITSTTPASHFSWLRSFFSSSTSITTTTIQSPLIPNMIKFDIIDTGIGISQENQSKLFHGVIQFSPGKLQNGGGSGLGLYISKGLMDAIGGVLSVSSEGEGLGTTFTILLPVVSTSKTVPHDLSGRQSHSELTVGEADNQVSRHLLSCSHPSQPLQSEAGHILSIMSSTSEENEQQQQQSQSQQHHLEEVENEEEIPASHVRSAAAASSVVIGCTNSSVHTLQTTVSGSGKSPILEIQLTSSHGQLLIPTSSASSSPPSTYVRSVLSGILLTPFSYFSQRKSEVKILPRRSLSHNHIRKRKKSILDSNSNLEEVNRKPVVLIVDDVALNRKMLQRLLTDRCASTIEAVDGQDAVTKVREAMIIGSTMFDIITMDYQMPVMDGVTATQQIRQMGYSGIIVGVTGNALPTDVSKFLMAGANRVLTKPLDVKKMDDVIRDMYSSWE